MTTVSRSRVFRGIVACLLAGCGGDGPVQPSRVATSITLSETAVSFASLGLTQQLTATVRDQNGQLMQGTPVAWGSSDDGVVTVSGDGLITAVANGDATIDATSQAASASVSAVVRQVAAALAMVMEPAGASAGQPFTTQPIVEVQDLNGHRIADDDGRLVSAEVTSAPAAMPTLLPASVPAVLVGTLTAETMDGVATFADLSLGGDVGDYSLAFHSDGLPGAASSQVFPLAPGPPMVLAAVAGMNADVIAGASVDASVRVIDGFGNGVPGEHIGWSVLTGGGTVDPDETTTDSQGVASTTWATGPNAGVQNQLVASMGEPMVSVQIATVPDVARAPFRFAMDTEWVAPMRSADLVVRDAGGRAVPPVQLDYTVNEYTFGEEPTGVLISDEGRATYGGLSVRPTWAYRIVAHHSGTKVEGIMLVVAHQTPGPRTIVASEHWRMVVPPSWIERIRSTVPDYQRAFDVGWEAQKELMGATVEEAWNAIPHADGQFLAQMTLMEDVNVCGLSTLPLVFGESCFVWPADPDPILGRTNVPRWFILFHEMGHTASLGQPQRAMFDLLMGGAPWTEGDASLLSFWSARRMQEAPDLSPAARESVRRIWEGVTPPWEADLQTWESGSAPFRDDVNFDFTANVWDGIHLRFMNEFGPDYILRYVRAWRIDPVVRALMDLDGAGTTTATRATFAAASLSAALRRSELRSRFEDDWRFPIVDPLFDQLYDHLLTAMDVPW